MAKRRKTKPDPEDVELLAACETEWTAASEIIIALLENYGGMNSELDQTVANLRLLLRRHDIVSDGVCGMMLGGKVQFFSSFRERLGRMKKALDRQIKQLDALARRNREAEVNRQLFIKNVNDRIERRDARGHKQPSKTNIINQEAEKLKITNPFRSWNNGK